MKHTRCSLILLVTFLVFTTIVSSTLAKEELPDIVKRISPSVVVIYIYDDQGKILSQGSGFFINKKGDVITNYHVLEGAHSGNVKTSKGNTYQIKMVLAEDTEGDLLRVSIEIPQNEVVPLSLGKIIPQAGEMVAVIGNPLGLELTVSDGIVSAVREIPDFGKIIQITAPISPGSSGSPVVNMKGEVIGVATFQIIEGQNLNFAIPIERVEKLILGKNQSLIEWRKDKDEAWLSFAEKLYSQGLSFFWIEDYEKAFAYFEKAVKEDSSFEKAYFGVAYCLGKLGRFNEAIVVFKQVIKIQPDYASAYYNLGWNYDKLERYHDAIESYIQAIRCKPNEAKYHYSLGLDYGTLKYDNKAIEVFKQAILIDPDFARAHYFLGLTYSAMRDKASAFEEYKILKTLDKELADDLINFIYKY